MPLAAMTSSIAGGGVRAPTVRATAPARRATTRRAVHPPRVCRPEANANASPMGPPSVRSTSSARRRTRRAAVDSTAGLLASMDERDPPPVDPNLELELDGVVVLNGSVDPDAAAPIARDEKDDDDDGPIFSGELFARLVRFTLPTMVIWLSGPILSMVDTAVVGKASTLELAAMTPGGVYVDYPSYLLSSALAVATTTLVAQERMKRRRARSETADGDGDGDTTVSDAVALAAILGLVVAIVLAVAAAPAVAKFAGPRSASIVPAALTYASIRCLGVPFALVASVAQASFLACKSPAQPLLAVGASGAVNLVADVVLVCGLGWGIGGAAAATVASQAVVAAALVYLLLKQGRERRAAAGGGGGGGVDDEDDVDDVRASYYEGGVILEDAEPASTEADEDAVTPPSLRAVPRSIPGLAQATRFLNIAGPVCFLNSIKVLFVASLVQAVTAISPASSAANGVMTAIYFFFAVMGDGVSQAAQTFLPPVLGSRRATGTAAMLLIAAAGLGALNAVASAGVALAMPGLFTKSAEVVAIMAECAPAMSVALLLHTASMGSEGCLLAARDMRFMSFCYAPNAALAYWTLTLCVGSFGMGASALWVALAQFHACRLVANGVRMFVLPGRGSPLRRKLAE